MVAEEKLHHIEIISGRNVVPYHFFHELRELHNLYQSAVSRLLSAGIFWFFIDVNCHE